MKRPHLLSWWSATYGRARSTGSGRCAGIAGCACRPERGQGQRARRSRSTFAVLALLALSPIRAANNDPTFNAPAINWVLPLFSPAGFRSFTLRGDEARLSKKDEIDVTNINITVFSGDATSRVTTVLLSPQATYFPSRNLATGPSSVRILRTSDGTDVSGEDWTYDFTQEKVSLRRNVRVVFHQALNDFLK